MKPFSLLDAMFLWAEQRQQPMHVAGLQLYTPPPDAGKGFVLDLIQSWRKHTHAVSPFNLRPRFRLGHWFWEEDKDFEIDYHLRHSALPRPGRVRELLALVSRMHGSLMDRSRPLWEISLIEGLADGRVAAYVKVHHALFDGMSATRMLQKVLSERPDEQRPPMWAQHRPRRARTDAPAESKLVGPLRAATELVPGIRSGLWEIVRSTEANPIDATPFQAPPTMLNVAISGSRRFAAQSYALERFKAIGKARGATVNDVALAACAGALRGYLLSRSALPDKPLIAMVPVSVRAADSESGNEVGLLLANLATHVADPFERLGLIIESTRVAKERLARMSRREQMARAIAMSSPLGPSMLSGHARRRPIFNLVISNVPGPRVPLYLDGMRLDENYPVSIPTDYMALNITIHSNCDLLCFGFIACRRSVPALQRMLDHLDESLHALEG